MLNMSQIRLYIGLKFGKHFYAKNLRLQALFGLMDWGPDPYFDSSRTDLRSGKKWKVIDQNWIGLIAPEGVSGSFQTQRRVEIVFRCRLVVREYSDIEKRLLVLALARA